MKLDWHFPIVDDGEEDGINDSLRETFEGDHERFIARECIQNAIDARKDMSRPAKVRFERFDIPVEKVPGMKELKTILAKAKKYSEDQDGSAAFYDSAIKMLEQPTISVLKVSDFNTTGLDGGDHDRKGRWYKLTRSTGVNSMAGVGGGSFGIGKGAPFAASGLRTVFYSTMNEDGEYAFQGKARISSFEQDADPRKGVGNFGEVGRQGVRGAGSIRDPEQIPEFFRRTEQGTDIYIVGYQTESQDWTRLLMNSLLNSFWPAVHFDELDVELAEEGKILHSVDEKNLGEHMAEYASGENDSFHFYKAIIDPSVDPFVGNLPLLGNVKLWVRIEEGLPKAVQMMRKSKMVVMTFTKYRVLSDSYAAVFICDDEEGNKLLRELEPPAHDKWDKNRNKEYGPKVYRELQEWVRDSLRSMRQERNDVVLEIPELNKWLPDADEQNDSRPGIASWGEKDEKTTDNETAEVVGTKREEIVSPISPTEYKTAAITRGFAAGEDGVPPLGSRKIKNKTNTSAADLSKPGELPRIDVSNVTLKAIEVTRDGKKVYKAILLSPDNEKGSIKIVGVGDDKEYPIGLENVSDASGKKLAIKDSTITELELEPDKPLTIYIELKRNKRYALGVA